MHTQHNTNIQMQMMYINALYCNRCSQVLVLMLILIPLIDPLARELDATCSFPT